MEFKEKLKRIREERGASRQTLAKAIFVSPASIAQWESGVAYPSEVSLTALSDYFGVPAAHFRSDNVEITLAAKGRRIVSLKIWIAAILAALLVAAALILPRTPTGTKLFVSLFSDPLQSFAQKALENPAESSQTLLGYDVFVYSAAQTVFFEGDFFGCRGFFYTDTGALSVYDMANAPFELYGYDTYLWREAGGHAWMQAERVTGNWYYYEMHR